VKAARSADHVTPSSFETWIETVSGLAASNPATEKEMSSSTGPVIVVMLTRSVTAVYSTSTWAPLNVPEQSPQVPAVLSVALARFVGVMPVEQVRALP